MRQLWRRRKTEEGGSECASEGGKCVKEEMSVQVREEVREGGSECVGEAAMGPVPGLGSALPSACAVGQEDEGVVGSVRLGLDAVCHAAVPSCFPSVIPRAGHGRLASCLGVIAHSWPCGSESDEPAC